MNDSNQLRLREQLVKSIHRAGNSGQEWGRYDRYEKFTRAAVRVVPKVSRVQLGETIDTSVRPPRRVNPVGKIMATHVDSFTVAKPSEALETLVEWGQEAEEFYYKLNLRVLTLQARRRGGTKAAAAAALQPAVNPISKLRYPSKAERVRRLMTSPSATLNLRLYKSDEDRRRQLDEETCIEFDSFALHIEEIKQSRINLAEQRRNIGVAADKVTKNDKKMAGEQDGRQGWGSGGGDGHRGEEGGTASLSGTIRAESSYCATDVGLPRATRSAVFTPLGIRHI